MSEYTCCHGSTMELSILYLYICDDRSKQLKKTSTNGAFVCVDPLLHASGFNIKVEKTVQIFALLVRRTILLTTLKITKISNLTRRTNSIICSSICFICDYVGMPKFVNIKQSNQKSVMGRHVDN